MFALQELQEWERKIDFYTERLQQIIIPKDLNPGQARNLINAISEILPNIIMDYHTIKGILNTIDATISTTEKKNFDGKNPEERKKNAVLAVESVEVDGMRVNLYELRNRYVTVFSKYEAIREVLLMQQNLLVSMNGFMKLERGVYGNEV